MDGCDWPVLYRWKIPDDAPVGFLPCRIDLPASRRRAFRSTPFRRGAPHPENPPGRILLMFATGTWTAYNDWGGANHYFGTWGPSKNEGSPVLSLKRPGQGE